MAAAVVKEPAGIGEHGNLERRHHRRLGPLHHVEGFDGALAADEHGGALHPLWPAREDRVLHEPGHVLDRHRRVGNGRVVAGIERHVHVERAHMLERRDHVQDAGMRHVVSFSVHFGWPALPQGA